jgi:predicted NBD/HSP70 family sugar kinase
MDGQPGSTIRRDELADLLAVPGHWTTLYLDGPEGSPAPERAARRASIRDRLARAGAPESHLDAALEALIDEGPPSPSTQTVLVRDGSVVLNELHAGSRLGAEVFAHGRVPRILPLLRERERDVGFLIVEVGREGGELRLAHGDARDVSHNVEVEGRTDFLTKVQAGGASQARYHRASEEVWRENADEVGKAVDRAVREHDPAFVVVSGDVRARELLLDELAPESLDRVVEVSAHTRAAGASSQERDDEIDARLDEQLERERQQVLTRSAEGGGRYGERGLGPVVHALQLAQVEALLLDPRDDERSLLALDAPPWIATDPGESLAAGVLEQVPALEALARAAVLTDARVFFLDQEPEDADAPRPDGDPAEPVAWMRWATGPDHP